MPHKNPTTKQRRHGWLLAFDPGLCCSGLAVFKDGRLVDTLLASTPTGQRDAAGAVEMLQEIRRVLKPGEFAPGLEPFWFIYERQQVYRKGRGENVNPDDLLQLAYVNGATAALVALDYYDPDPVGYLPREWKGQVPKDKHHPRIMASLTDGEREKAEADLGRYTAHLRHNAIDAIGIGLRWLRR